MSGSDRWSDRVELDDEIAAGQRPFRPFSAPESMPSGVRATRALAAEGERRISRQDLRQLGDELSQRERSVLVSVDTYGFLTTGQVQQLHFFTHATPEAAARICRRVLSRLKRDRLLEPLERRIGGLRAGSRSYVWRVGPAGDRLLRNLDPDAPRARRKEPSSRFLAHRLAVAECAVRLLAAGRDERFEVLHVEPEPGSWRRYTGDYNSREILKPDLFVVTADGDYEDHWFIEIDRGTESLPTVMRQCEQYERYRRTGTEQGRVGLFPRVLWLVPDQRRQQRLVAAIERADLDNDLFLVHQYGDLLAAITTNPKGGDS